jgi:protein SCO1/2
MMRILLAWALFAAVAHAQAPPVDRVAFAPRAGTLLPRDARFVDERGHGVELGDYLDARAAIVVPAYFACSNLCGVVARGVVASLAASGLAAGRDVEVIVVSIDPSEQSADALAKKREVVGPETPGWHFLVGDASSVARFADALGYRYVYDEHERQYGHAAGIVITSIGGRVKDVMYGVAYPPDALRASVRGAASHAQSTTTEWMLCFHYDPATGRYSFAVMSAVRLVAVAALLALAVFMLRKR